MALEDILSDQKKMKAFIERRHPEYEEKFPQWNFWDACYKGGREWFKDNIFRYLREGDKEYDDRVGRAYRFNHSREVVDLINRYIFKGDVQRNVDDAPDSIKRFWRSATRSELNIDQFMKKVSQAASIFGRAWVVVDSNMPEGAVSIADEKRTGAKVYAYLVPPQHILDMSYDEDGNLAWILIAEARRDDADPFESTGAIVQQFRLWTKTDWYLFELEPDGRSKKMKVILVDQDTHDLGMVPVIHVDNVETDDPYTAPSLIGDIAYLDRAVANYLSNLDAIIQDQTFSQLAMPAQGLMPGEDGYNKLLEMGTKRIFIYDAEGSSRGPEYISPDPKQAQMVLAVINKIISEIYHTVGMGGERTKQDNAVGIDNSSGVAKAYDFERMNALLVAKADALDNFENRMLKLVRMWYGETIKEDQPDLVKYPDNFDVRGLYDEFDIAMQLALIEAPDAMRQEQMKAIVEKLFPRLSKDLTNKMLSELKDWPPEPVVAEGSISDTKSVKSKGLVTKTGTTQGQNNKPAEKK